jgi:hypothetical protein
VGSCGGGAGDGGGGSRARPAAGRVEQLGGPAQALAPFPVPGCNLLCHFRGWPATAGGSRAPVCGCCPEDADTLWQRDVGVLRLMPVTGCVRVSGSVGRL